MNSLDVMYKGIEDLKLDYKDYKINCQFCHENCEGFRISCKTMNMLNKKDKKELSLFTPVMFENRIVFTVKKIIKKFGSHVSTCSCKTKIYGFLNSTDCPFCMEEEASERA